MKMVRILSLVILPVLFAGLMTGCTTTGYASSETKTSNKYTSISPPAAITGTTEKPAVDAGLIPGQTTPSREEELWVIAKSNQASPVAPNDQLPGTGSLLARLPNEPQSQPIPVPLKHTDVKADIAGYIATVNVTQQYQNPFSSKIEAIYVFPLPHNAAVNEFIMTIGDRHIRGIIRERAEAQRIYDSAKSQGYVASLLTQDRPNIFMQSVANIEPGKQIDIAITYFHTLEYSDGWYKWHFPIVVGQRRPRTTAAGGCVDAATDLDGTHPFWASLTAHIPPDGGNDYETHARRSSFGLGGRGQCRTG